MGKGIKNRGSQVHHVKRGDLLAKEHAKEMEVWQTRRSMKKFKTEVQVVNDSGWYSNSLIFDSYQEAKEYAQNLCDRWTSTTDWRVIEVEPEIQVCLSNVDKHIYFEKK